MELKEKNVLITGGSSGIGRQIAVYFAREEANVIFTYKKDKKGALETGKLIRNEGMASRALKLDHTKKKDRESIFKILDKEYGELHVLVNNAGGHIRGKDKYNPDAWDGIVDINLNGPIHLTTILTPLIEKVGGSVLNITSAYGLLHCGSTVLPAYSAAKAGMNSFTKTYAKDKEGRIRVNSIAPGYVETPMWGKLGEREKSMYGSHQLIGRFIQPEEIAEAAVFISKNEAITGEVLVLDGGISLKTI